MGDHSPAMVTVRAPGRVNLIGEHTDYNEGFVLPAAITLETRIAIEPRRDRIVEMELVTTGEAESFDLDAIGGPRGTWIDYIAGVARTLIDADQQVGGFNGELVSDVPVSAGLSSSAALELAAAWALIVAGGARAGDVDCVELARLCQRAENDFVGVKSGLMDQFAASCGVSGHALLLDCRSLEYRAVRVPTDLELVVVDTGSRRRLVASEYNLRRDECEHGVAVLRARGEPIIALRDATIEMLDRAAGELGDRVYRRCRHVVDENARTLAAARALEAGDRSALAELFAASQASLRDLYEVSSPELNVAVEIARATPGVVAARLTGAGFGGCRINVVEPDARHDLARTFERDYSPRTGLTPRVYAVSAADGAGYVAE
jgi:galactokinase